MGVKGGFFQKSPLASGAILRLSVSIQEVLASAFDILGGDGNEIAGGEQMEIHFAGFLDDLAADARLREGTTINIYLYKLLLFVCLAERYGQLRTRKPAAEQVGSARQLAVRRTDFLCFCS